MRFFLGAITAGVLTIVFSAFYLLTIPFDKKNRSFSFFAYHWSNTVLKVAGIKVRTIGREIIDISKPYVYVSNHASMFDITAVVVGVNRYVRFLVKKELGRVPLFGWATGRAHIMVDRKSGPEAVKSLKKIAERISLGESAILFAEGTRTRDGKLQPFKRGAFVLAIEAGVPVVPLTILGSYEIMKRGSVGLRKGEIIIVVDPPIDVTPYRDKQGSIELMNRVHGIIERNYTAKEPAAQMAVSLH
ncbi:MAG TPA: lysophospholipid acyltransferase family protein [Candidatus Kryptonia bacterium]